MKLKRKTDTKESAAPSDGFITYAYKSLRFIRAHLPVFAMLAGAVVVAVVSVLVMKSYAQIREEDGALEFGKAYSYYQVKVHQRTESGDTPLTIVYANALEQFENVIEKYKNTEAGRMSMLYAAQCAYWGQQYDKAISYYQEFLSRLREGDSFRELAWSGMAYSYQAKGDCDKALEYFQKIVDVNGFEKAYAYYNMAQCYEKLQDMEKARQAEERLKKEFPDSLMALWIDAKSGTPPPSDEKKGSETRQQ